MDALDQEREEWVKHGSGIITKYNNTTHSTIEIKPNDAIKPSNHLWVAWHLQNAAKHNRPYEEINKGGMFRIILKNNKFDKAHMPNWSSEKYKVLGIGKNNFLLSHPTKRKVFMRHEIRK